MNGVIIIAPAEANWAVRAGVELGAAHLLLGRLYEPTLISVLIRGSRVRAVAIDSRLVAKTLQLIRREALGGSLRLLLVHEGPDQVVHGALRSSIWPTSIDSVRTLIGA